MCMYTLCAACSVELGCPGAWRKSAIDLKQDGFVGTFHTSLHDKHSLIGQLCPGLRLCLAAEVATGLMCDRWVGV
jgi:hypothetical protein